MKSNFLFLTMLILILCISCLKNISKNVDQQDSILMEFRMYFYDDDICSIKKYLEQGNDPNKCLGSYGWIDENPLWVALDNGEDNIDIINLLISYGADVNLRPYIWHIIDHRILTPDDLLWLEDISEDVDGKATNGTTEELIYKKIEVLINAGADVDAMGARNKLLFPSNDVVYKAYFAKEGSRPINYAIKKNLPSIVDLLLQHTKLDEYSLFAAEESGNSIMVEKINKIWDKQQLISSRDAW